MYDVKDKISHSQANQDKDLDTEEKTYTDEVLKSQIEEEKREKTFFQKEEDR